MSQSVKVSEVQDALSLQNRVTELESVLRTVLEQINTHQVYDKDARALIRRSLRGMRAQQDIGTPNEGTAPPRRATEFPSFFPSATRSSNFI